MVRYIPKFSALLTYKTSSEIQELNNINGIFEITNEWPGIPHSDDYIVGDKWFTDKKDNELFEDKWQGAGAIRKWREEILEDWTQRWKCLKND